MTVFSLEELEMYHQGSVSAGTTVMAVHNMTALHVAIERSRGGPRDRVTRDGGGGVGADEFELLESTPAHNNLPVIEFIIQNAQL